MNYNEQIHDFPFYLAMWYFMCYEGPILVLCFRYALYNLACVSYYNWRCIGIYKVLCLDEALARMNGVPNEIAKGILFNTVLQENNK